MEIEFIDLRGICNQLNNEIMKVKGVAEDLANIMAMLQSMQDSCIGLSTKIGDKNYTITKEGDRFVFAEVEPI